MFMLPVILWVASPYELLSWRFRLSEKRVISRIDEPGRQGFEVYYTHGVNGVRVLVSARNPNTY